MRRLIVFCCLALALYGVVQPFARAEIAASPEYLQCVDQTSKDPRAALNTADEWQKRGGALGARHCRAMALFALARYADSALELEALADSVTDKQPVLWLNILSQAGRARIAGNELALGYRDLSLGVDFAIANDTVPGIRPILLSLLSDRADVFARMGKPYDGIQDIDHAISIAEKDASLRIKRAAILIQMNETALAKQDLDAALKLDPDNAQARIMIAGITKQAVIQ